MGGPARHAAPGPAVRPGGHGDGDDHVAAAGWPGGRSLLDQFGASGGTAPYTWAKTSGTIPAGLSLATGAGGSSAADFTFIGVNTGPQGAPSLAAWNTATYGNSAGTGTFGSGLLGALGCYKTFFSTFPSTWVGSLMAQITAEQPNVFTYICWNNLATQAQINAFVQTIPHNVIGVGFCWNSEPENTGASGLTVSTFTSGWADQMSKVYNAKAITPVPLYTMTTSYLAYYQGAGTPTYLTQGSQWIPPATYTDIYGFDFYDRATYNAGPDMSSTKGWQIWTGYVKNLGKPLALTEFGLSGYANDAAQNTRLQNDLAYLKGAFGAGGSLSQSPLFCWLYWDTGGAGFYTALPSPPNNKNQFLGTGTEKTWKGIAGLAANQPSTGSGTGGLLSGTPTAAGTSSFSVTATDANSNVSSPPTSLSITISAAGTLSVLTTSSDLAGGTVGAAYSATVQAAGGRRLTRLPCSRGRCPRACRR